KKNLLELVPTGEFNVKQTLRLLLLFSGVTAPAGASVSGCRRAVQALEEGGLQGRGKARGQAGISSRTNWGLQFSLRGACLPALGEGKPQGGSDGRDQNAKTRPEIVSERLAGGFGRAASGGCGDRIWLRVPPAADRGSIEGARGGNELDAQPDAQPGRRHDGEVGGDEHLQRTGRGRAGRPCPDACWQAWRDERP